MQESENSIVGRCPYFLQDMQTCSLCTDGFYLPSKENLLTHCLSPIYSKCRFYEKSRELKKEKTLSVKDINGSRRQFKRNLIQQKVLIRSCNSDGNLTNDFAEMAITIDYSASGMRILSRKQIPAGAWLIYNFDHHFTIPQLQGFAQICWHRVIENIMECFETGLIFKEMRARPPYLMPIECEI